MTIYTATFILKAGAHRLKVGPHHFFLQKSLVIPNKSRTFAPTVPATPPNNAYHGGTSSFLRV